MARRTWADNDTSKPLSAARMNALEGDLESALLSLARAPEALFSGAITRDVNGAPTKAGVIWPDGVAGTYTGTPSKPFPGAVEAYSVTYSGANTITFTQPAVTRDVDGNVIDRPAIIIS